MIINYINIYIYIPYWRFPIDIPYRCPCRVGRCSAGAGKAAASTERGRSKVRRTRSGLGGPGVIAWVTLVF